MNLDDLRPNCAPRITKKTRERRALCGGRLCSCLGPLKVALRVSQASASVRYDLAANVRRLDARRDRNCFLLCFPARNLTAKAGVIVCLFLLDAVDSGQIGRASCRERVWKYV